MSKRRVKGVAPRSVTLTYAQLKFLDGKPNASVWVREAIEQAMKIEAGELIVAKLGEDHGSRLIREGVNWRTGPRMEEPWLGIVEAVFDVAEAHESAKARDAAAGDTGEQTARAFQIPGFTIAHELKTILQDSLRLRQ
ncbi:MAG: hypothetical protein NWE89_12105 [Candidatus Bathyarchaeota archaeon]|nr:hypothetical protein [Candidatus Bathyarchaeota archaeon]